MTEIEEFVKDHLIYINRIAGEIEYVYEGDRLEEGFSKNPLTAIRAAIKRIKDFKAGIE